ncbi:MAG: UTP--glucose-1-phosphate uridylyltransferase GalU [Proteobacteria bacterium]|nr:UTP--glucose-1-phosphate uridylyltransferase GalU [Pseudomonadota bacterium]MBI3498018.1 UTP--glucose-1-phosphate uridylyltransferase GalU [Pseudomonadota bacterium]
MAKARANTRVRKAIFPVGGLGTRFLPATKAMPKEMLPVVDKPLIQYAVEEARAAGIEEFVFVTGRGKSAIEDHFDHSYELAETLRQRGKTAEYQELMDSLPEPGQVAYTRQQEPLGLGHAVWCARNLVADEPVAVLLADDLILSDRPCLQQMMEHYRDTGGNLVAVMQVDRAQTKSYGVVRPGKTEGALVEVLGLVEKPEPEVAPSTLAVVGRYILQPAVFGHLARGHRGSGDEIQLTDALARMIGNGPFHGVAFEGRRFDCGTRVGFLDANIAFALKRPDMVDRVRDILARYR